MTRVFSSLLKEARHFTVTFKAADCFRTSGFKQSGNSMDDIWIHEERFCLMARSISCRRLVPWLLPGIMLKQWGQQDLPRQSWLFHFFKEFGSRVFLLQASTRIQVRNTHYYFTCLEMEIVSTLINDLKDCLISVTTSVSC